MHQVSNTAEPVPAEGPDGRRCGARRKSDGQPCQAWAMPNGRCRLHGGKSTGPRTPEGLEASRRARWKHGQYSAEARAARKGAVTILDLARFVRDVTEAKMRMLDGRPVPERLLARLDDLLGTQLRARGAKAGRS